MFLKSYINMKPSLTSIAIPYSVHIYPPRVTLLEKIPTMYSNRNTTPMNITIEPQI
jgi:hypothetical protein